MVHAPGYATEVGEIEDGAAVTGIDDGVELDACAEGADDGLVDLVIKDHAAVLEVLRAERLVVAVHLVAVVIQLLDAVAGEVEHQGVAGGAALHQPPHRQPDVVLGRQTVRVLLLLCPSDGSSQNQSFTYSTSMKMVSCLLTREGQNAVAGEAKPLAEQVGYAVDVVDGAFELVLGEAVADANEERPLLATGARVAGRQAVRVTGTHRPG